MFPIVPESGTYRYPEFAGISNSLPDTATGNRRVICMINRYGRYLVNLKYLGRRYFSCPDLCQTRIQRRIPIIS
jgi:hypothetical protein